MVIQSPEPAALEETLADLRDLYHNAPCGFHSLDATGKYVRVNATEAQWLGIPIEELVGRVRFQEVLTPRSAAAYLASVEGARSRWPIRDLALELKCRDGSTRPVVLHANPIRDGRGNPVLNRSVLIDRWVPASAEPPPSGRADAVATTLRANARRAGSRSVSPTGPWHGAACGSSRLVRAGAALRTRGVSSGSVGARSAAPRSNDRSTQEDGDA